MTPLYYKQQKALSVIADVTLKMITEREGKLKQEKLQENSHDAKTGKYFSHAPTNVPSTYVN